MNGVVQGYECPICRKFRTKCQEQLQRHASTCQDKTRLRQASRELGAATTASPQATSKVHPVEPRCASTAAPQPDADLILKAKPHGCCAVIGRVCWFCHKGTKMLGTQQPLDSTISETAHGGLPILYHASCVAAIAATQTDTDIIMAYKTFVASGAPERQVRRALPMGVKLSTMRRLSSSWLHGHRKTTATPSKSVPVSKSVSLSYGKKHVSGDSLASNSDSEDSRPLGRLAEESLPLQQLAARRTPFAAAAAQHATPDAAQGTLVNDSPSFGRKQPPTPLDIEPVSDIYNCTNGPQTPAFSGRTSVPTDSTSHMQDLNRASGLQQTRPATSAAQIFGPRPGHTWHLGGCVTDPPPVWPDENKVLSHHQSRQVTEMYEKAQENRQWSVKVLQDFETLKDLWTSEFRLKVEKAAKAYLKRNMPKALLLSNLPKDPPCLSSLRVEPVREGDFRKGLRPGIDVTVRTDAAIAKGTVLGLYRNITVTKAEEKVIRNNPPADFTGTKNEWRQRLDAYTADVEQPAKGTKSARQFDDIFTNVLQGQTLNCLGYMNGNILACINDGSADPMSEEPDESLDKPANAQLVCIAVGRWPFMFMVATDDIEPDDELFLNYGESFWDFQKEGMERIQEDVELEQKFERTRASGAFGLDSGGASQHHLTRSGPAPETAMSANHNYSAPIHGTPIHHAPTAPTALPGTHLVPVNMFDGDAAEEDRGQEAAAESQPSPVDVYDLHGDDDRQDMIGVGGTESVAMQDLQAAAATAQDTSAASSPFEVNQKFRASNNHLSHVQQHDLELKGQVGTNGPTVTGAGLNLPKSSALVQLHDSDTSTQPNSWRRPLLKDPAVEDSIYSYSGTMEQLDVSAAKQQVFGRSRLAAISRLSSATKAAARSCLKAQGFHDGSFSNATLFASATSPPPSPASGLKRQRQDAQSDAQPEAQRHRAAPQSMEAADSAEPKHRLGTDGVTQTHTSAKPDSAPQSNLAADEAGRRQRQASQAADSSQEPTGNAANLEQLGCNANCAGAQPAGITGAGVAHKRQLDRLDSGAGSTATLPGSTAAAKKVRRHEEPLFRHTASHDRMKSPDKQHAPAQPGRTLNSGLGTSVNSRRTAYINSSSDQGKADLAASCQHKGSGTNNGPRGQRSDPPRVEPPRFSQTHVRPAVGKSRFGGISDMGKGDAARSAAGSGESGSKHHSKGSDSVKAVGSRGTQDTAAASDGVRLQKKSYSRPHGPPANIPLKPIPRRSMQDRHSASLHELRRSKAGPVGVPASVSTAHRAVDNSDHET